MYIVSSLPDSTTRGSENENGARRCQPWNTQELTRRILRLMYGSDSTGYAFPGMRTRDPLPFWYVMSAQGFYPVDPSSPDYILGSPVFDEATVHMGNGKDLVIVARNNSRKNLCIQSATLSGKPWNKPWFSHDDMKNGARLMLTMGSVPNRNRGGAPQNAPPTMSPRS